MRPPNKTFMARPPRPPRPDSYIAVFQGSKLRKVWNPEKQLWYFSLVDIIGILSDSINPTDYLKKLRKRDHLLNSYLGTNCPQVGMVTHTGKLRKTLAGTVSHCFFIIKLFPSRKARSLGIWLSIIAEQSLGETQIKENLEWS